ncbi:MAG: HEAT repeat domain-containing protein [Desulfobacterales bacterium]
MAIYFEHFSDLRTQALDSLGKIKDPATVEKILPLLYDKDPKIRGKSVQTLGEIGDSQAAVPISRHLADSDLFVRKLAEEALIKLERPEEEIKAWKKKAEGMTLEAEITKLSVAAERTRTEAENAKKELATLRDREAELARQVDELKKTANPGNGPGAGGLEA